MREKAIEDHHLQALGAMGSMSFANPEDLFDHGLNLLVRHLGVDRATVASLAGRSLENLWCAGGPAVQAGEVPFSHDPNLNFCAHVLRAPGETLAIPDATLDPLWAYHPGWKQLGVRSYIGAPLRYAAKAMGVLSVQSGSARIWHPSDAALVNAMAALFAKAMEVESLKARLWQVQEHLDLTSAVMEDSALENPRSGLPSGRYLDLWCRSHLRQARRRGEVIALVTWIQPPDPGRGTLLGQLAGSLRGVDLLVDIGQDWFLLVLPRTLRPGAEVVLERLRRTLGPVPMGATLWNPLLSPDREDPGFQPAIRRAQRAGAGRREPKATATGAADVAWTLLEPTPENLLGRAGAW